MAIKSKIFTIVGFSTAVLCLICVVISFASDQWVASTEKERSGFKNIGLWSACFSAYRPPAWSLVDRYYDGCWWVFDREIDELRHFLFPGWFVGTQALVTLGLILQIMAIIIMIINIINCFPYNKFKDTIRLGLCLGGAILHLMTGIFLTVAVIMFGARADNERTWLEKPDQNYLSWSFGICVLAAYLAYVAFMCHVVEFCRLRLEQGYSPEPQVFLTTRPPPPSNYMYAENVGASKTPPANKPTPGQPGYIIRVPSYR